MKNRSTFAFAFAAAALALAGASVCAAQAAPPTSDGTPVPTPPSTATSTPATSSTSPTVTVNATPNSSVKVAKPKLVKYKGRVLAFNIAAIIVQSMDNPRMVWTFQYSTELHNTVASMLGAGGFTPGDMVTVYCNSGTTVAVKLKGKHAKTA